MDLLKKSIGTLLILMALGELPSSQGAHGTSNPQDVPVTVVNEGTCTIQTANGDGMTITAPFPAQMGGSPEIGLITVKCNIDGKTYAAISSSLSGPWDTTAMLTGTSGGSVHAEIGKRTQAGTITAPTVVPSAGTVTTMVGNDKGEFDLQLNYADTNPDRWTLYVLAGRWSD